MRGAWATSKARDEPTIEGVRETWERLWKTWERLPMESTRHLLAKEILMLSVKQGTPTYYAITLVDKANHFLKTQADPYSTEWAEDIPK